MNVNKTPNPHLITANTVYPPPTVTVEPEARERLRERIVQSLTSSEGCGSDLEEAEPDVDGFVFVVGYLDVDHIVGDVVAWLEQELTPKPIIDPGVVPHD